MYGSKILKIKTKNAKQSFYGTANLPTNQKLLVDTSSDPDKDEDLYGYYEIYQSATAKNFLGSIIENNCKELSPADVLFLLEFQVEETKDKNNKRVVTLNYVPQRFYHKYARGSSEDVSFATQRFNSVIKSNPEQAKLYLCHIELGKAHAFCARKLNNNWVLLDSLRKCPVKVKEENAMFEDYTIGGRASLMVFPDNTRASKVLASMTL